jgi:cytochrome c biogenesis protein CcdA
VNHGLVGLAFASGLVAALNPCGFAMLPGYLLLVVRGESSDGHPAAGGGPTGWGALARASAATAMMSLGFLTVFGVFGALTVSAATTVQRFLPYLTVVIGVALVALGVWLLLGRRFTLLMPKSLAKQRIPTIQLGSMYGYGVSYAIASLSCTVGPFLAVTAASLRGGSLLGSVAVYFAYVVGLTLVVGVLAVAAAAASSVVAGHLRRILPWVNRIGGALMVPVGIYVGYYGVYEVRSLGAHHDHAHHHGQHGDSVIGGAGRLQDTLAGWVHQHGAWPWLLVLAVVVAGV